jgi:putative hemolysin
MMWLLGRLPRTGDIAAWENWQLEVVDLDGKRVDKVLASSRPEPLESAQNAEESQISTGNS